MKKILFAVLLACAFTSARAGVVGKEIDYTSGGTTLKGYLAFDDSNDAKRPGILVVHEWWGHNEYARKRARMLAELGYIAFAVDMYGDGKTAAHPDDAKKFSAEVMQNLPVGEARFRAAEELLKKQPQTDTEKIGAVGYCFGGGVILHMARIGEDLAGVASFHGSLATAEKAKPDAVKARILVCTGGADSFIPPEAVKEFETEMSDAHAKFKIISYKDAKHSFTNPDADKFGEEFKLPLAYNKDADEKSWSDMKIFFREVFAAHN